MPALSLLGSWLQDWFGRGDVFGLGSALGVLEAALTEAKLFITTVAAAGPVLVATVTADAGLFLNYAVRAGVLDEHVLGEASGAFWDTPVVWCTAGGQDRSDQQHGQQKAGKFDDGHDDLLYKKQAPRDEEHFLYISTKMVKSQYIILTFNINCD